MPKMKSKSGAKKRFSFTATGKIKRMKCNAGHILTKKNQRRKRHLRDSTVVHTADEKRIRQLVVG